jgi:peptidoglycan/LPS O-acetylase OafA/YrhL
MVSHPQENYFKYRPDIDGLRAVAVLAVVIFHASPSILRGGFAGVDIFFVISGFLITGLILDSIRKNKFQFSDFYVRRIIRIFPALFLVVACTLAFGWFANYGAEFRELGKQSLSGILFYPNLVFLREAGYFDASSGLKPLLHLWSLGVEEQFYLFWPTALIFLWQRKLLFSVVLIAGLSFALNLGLVSNHPDAAFYLPFSRFWEMLIGAALAVEAARESRREALKIRGLSELGFAMIVLSFFVIHPGRAFPGWWAILPTVGTALAIYGGPRAWINRAVLSHPIAVALGLVSYPLYLWHWPLLYFTNILGVGNPYGWARWVAVVIALVLAVGTYRLLEIPLRGLSFSLKRKTSVFFLAGGVLLSVLSFAASHSDNGRTVNASFTLGRNLSKMSEEACVLEEADRRKGSWCMSDRRAPSNAAVVGDSNANALYPGLLEYPAEGTRWTLLAKNGGCIPMLGVTQTQGTPQYAEDCRDFSAAVSRSLLAHEEIKLVLIVTKRPTFPFEVRLEKSGSNIDLTGEETYRQGIENFVAPLLKAGKTVVLMVHNPDITPDPEFCLSRPLQIAAIHPEPKCSIARASYDQDSALMRKVFQSLQAKMPKLFVFDPSDALCGETDCPVIKDGRSLYSYTTHLSDIGNASVAQEFDKGMVSNRIAR